ncbi:hypothetical protein QBC44DRAFT_401370 [Cladorrhinum sp. PSN332]|nr:hypothetical protein QBC44DRAFT_401370 [Cladorrhinum sp. PSN332]
MDPISALGLTAAVVQFVTFASQILAIAISPDSTAQATADLESLQEVCLKLNTQSLNLDTKARLAQHAALSEGEQANTSSDTDSRLLQSYQSLCNLLSKCEAVCKEIIEVVNEVKAKHNPSSKWSNFAMAVKLQLNKDRAVKIEERLKRYQGMVCLEMCNISIIYHDIHLKNIASFRRESQDLGVQQGIQLNAIQSTLNQIVDRGKGAATAPSASAEISALEEMMSKVRLSEEMTLKELTIVRSLGYNSRTVRHEAIPYAHQKTFEWIFETDDVGTRPQDLQPEINPPVFMNWLRHGNGAFWISGKPGSGKSTLMKFVSNHQTTAAALSLWSRPLPAVIASHYFWSLGTEMQKSQKGLLQSLIYDIFRHCPSLLKAACPSRWDAREQAPWALSELRSTLESLLQQPQIPCKFCFFIDGLDEYEGDHLDFCASLSALLGSSHIKLCVSSRPWNVFEDFFGREKQQKMYIHHFTRPDILRYARDRLHQHPRWKLLGLQTAGADSLIESIGNKAQGVFLWVFIVTRFLREGLTNDETFTDLQRILESFPSDLEPFFKQIIESVPEFSRKRTCEVLRLALSAREPLNSMIYSCHTECDGLKTPISLPLESVRARRERILRRLNGWCKGLLELNQLDQVDFLHRTVADFLRTRDMSKYLSSHTSPDFSPSFAIVKAYAVWLKLSNLFYIHSYVRDCFSLETNRVATPMLHRHSPLASTIRTALEYAHTADTEDTVDKRWLDDVIGSLDSAVAFRISSRPPQAPPGSSPISYGYDSGRLFREIVLSIPLIGYISRELPRNPAYFSNFEQPALYVVLHYPEPHAADQWPDLVSDKVTYLLSCGHDANVKLHGTGETVWTNFVDEAMGSKFLSTLRCKLFQIFLENGNANPNARLRSAKLSILDRFINLAASVPHDGDAEVGYLMALEVFISRGASIKKYASTSLHDWDLSALSSVDPRDPPRVKEPFLAAWERDLMNGTPTRVRYLENVIRRVLPLLQDSGWPLENYPKLVSTMPNLPLLGPLWSAFGAAGNIDAGTGDTSTSAVKRRSQPEGGVPGEGRRKKPVLSWHLG